MNVAIDGRREPHGVVDLVVHVLRPRTRGGWRLVEGALTLLAIPLLALALAAPKLFGPRRRTHNVIVVSSAQIAIAVPIAGVLAYAAAIATGVNPDKALAVVGVMTGAWIARGLLRWATTAP